MKRPKRMDMEEISEPSDNPAEESAEMTNAGPPGRGHIKKESLLGDPMSTPFGNFGTQAPPRAAMPKGMGPHAGGIGRRKRII